MHIGSVCFPPPYRIHTHGRWQRVEIGLSEPIRPRTARAQVGKTCEATEDQTRDTAREDAQACSRGAAGGWCTLGVRCALESGVCWGVPAPLACVCS